jgi:hypothetical protein
VADHKTTRDFKWAKTPEDLRDNFQAALYAADAMVRTRSNECDLEWIYYRTSGANRAARVHLRVTRDEIKPALARGIALADEMHTIESSGCKALDLPPNVDACEAFGGCEYQSNCNLNANDKYEALMSQATMADFLARMKNKANGTAINPPPTAPEPPAAIAPDASAVPSSVPEGHVPGFAKTPKARAKVASAPAPTIEPAPGVPTQTPLERAILAAAKAFVEAMGTP